MNKILIEFNGKNKDEICIYKNDQTGNHAWQFQGQVNIHTMRSLQRGP